MGSQGLARGSQNPSPAAVDDYMLPGHLHLPSFAPPAHLALTIYPSEEGVIEQGGSGHKGQSQGAPMLTAAVRIHLDPHKNIKVRLPRQGTCPCGWAAASPVDARAPFLTLTVP